MLVLSRKVGEEIVIPELGIRIEVLRTNRNQVRIGIDAPDSIKILRGELSFEDVSPRVEEYPLSIMQQPRMAS
jgi:carbon storage regulator